MFAASAFGQVTNSVTPRAATPRLYRVVGGNLVPAQGGPDAFDSLVASAASFDMDAPVEVKAEFDPPVAMVGGNVTYRVVLTALDESVKVPDKLPTPPELQLSQGGRGQAYNNMGGQKLRPQTTILYHLTPTNTGTFTIPSFEIDAYSKPVKVPEAKLTVLPTGSIKPYEPPRLLIELPKEDVYVGQSFRIPLILPETEETKVGGFTQAKVKGEFLFSEPLSLGMHMEPIQRNGKMVQALIQEVLVTALREGEQEIIGQAHSVSSQIVPGPTPVFQSTSTLIDSDRVKLRVKPLPEEGKLPGFTGAVGNYQLEPPKISKDEVRAGEPITMTINLHGDGNLGRLTPPQVPSLKDWEGFPPVADNSLPPSIVQQRGFTTFTYTLIPLSEKVSETPAIPFSYFDPRKKTYIDLTIPPVPIHVNPAPGGALALKERLEQGNPVLKSFEEEKPPVMTGIMENSGRVVSSLTPLQQNWWFLGLQVIPAAGIGGLWAWDRRRRFLEQNPDVVLKRKARRGLRKQLRAARHAAARGDAAGFVSSGVHALREACAPHVPAKPEALVCADVLNVLASSDNGRQSSELVRRFFAVADGIRFGGPSREVTELLSLQPELEKLLAQLKERL
jgi:BatD DUF11 like domain